MKILGHAYIATHAIDGDNQLLIVGSLLPEMLSYVPNDVFEYKELHEGGKKLLRYLDNHYPEKRDLALGMLSHGVEHGADKFIKQLEGFISGKRRSFLEKISQANSISLKFAEYRVHNFLGLGIDWLLIRNESELVREVQQALRKINVEKVSHLLAKGFEKDKAKVGAMVETLFKEIYQPEDLTSVKGLARIWARQTAGLPEKDQVDVQRAAEIIEECANLLREKWEDYLANLVNSVKLNLKPFV